MCGEMTEVFLAVELALEDFNQDGHVIHHNLLERHLEEQELRVCCLLVPTSTPQAKLLGL